MNAKLLLGLALVLSGGLFDVRASDAATNAPASDLVEQFKNSEVFWRQFEFASNLVALHDTNVLPRLAGLLTNDDRHLRGNAAFVFAGMGDDRGFQVLQEILTDRTRRPAGQGIPGGRWTLRGQIAADRYCAVQLFGALKDPRAVPILVPLLRDGEVKVTVPWSLGNIGDKRAVQPLLDTLNDQDPDMRILAIYALERLKAVEALPRLRELLNDNARNHLGKPTTVAEVAKAAIAKMEETR